MKTKPNDTVKGLSYLIEIGDANNRKFLRNPKNKKIYVFKTRKEANYNLSFLNKPIVKALFKGINPKVVEHFL